MRLLIKSIATLVSLALLAALAAHKIGGLFPAMDWIAWMFVLVGFCFVIYLSIRADGWMKRLPWQRLREKEGLREGLAIIAVGLACALVIVFLWPLIGQYVAPHFGTAVR
jgi:O-antigen/teichoic acid export membrane protein